MLTYFYQSHHCKKLLPILEHVGKYYEGKMLTVAKIDGTRFAKAAKHFDIKGYPTIKLYSKYIERCYLF